jgi:hypothetical protein
MALTDYSAEIPNPPTAAPRSDLQADQTGAQKVLPRNAEPGRFDDAVFDAAVWGD